MRFMFLSHKSPKRSKTWSVFFGMLILTVCANAEPTKPSLAILRPMSSNGWVRLNSSLQPDSKFILEASTNLTGWNAIGTLHDALFNYPDAAAAGFRERFYRVQAMARGSSDDWKNQAWFPFEPLGSSNAV